MGGGKERSCPSTQVGQKYGYKMLTFFFLMMDGDTLKNVKHKKERIVPNLRVKKIIIIIIKSW